MNDDPYTMRIIPEDEESSRMVTLRTSAIRGALDTTQPEAQSANGTNSNDASAGAAQENAATYSEAAPMADMGDGGDMSPLTEVATENISRELAVGPESWNWTPMWLAAIREATPEPPETSDVPGSISNPLMVLDNEESGDSRGAAVAAASTARDLQTPSPVRVKMQGSPSSRLRRLGVKGVQLSPRVFWPRTPAETGPSNDAQESAGQHEEEEQQQQQSPVGDPAWTQQTALPPPSQGESAHAGDDEDEAMGVVEELTDIVNRNFTQHRFVLGV
ncbi:hypothetical protein LEL_07082 [Akanthomyces lecanii RCEF 1005]|uniref:Uncharacterized protein n=1 Tax=Akanthomyces lecanii RCEF 1005 TaxID=1081108 RepID=A0A162LSM9_CORDF|nr:hypothetical protein LEL_07082 [Akanthomyces lecanii RCEF 1005]